MAHRGKQLAPGQPTADVPSVCNSVWRAYQTNLEPMCLGQGRQDLFDCPLKQFEEVYLKLGELII